MKKTIAFALALWPAVALAAASSSYTGSDAMNRLAASYNVKTDDINGLRDMGWSWNEIGDVLAVTKRSGRPLREVVAERDSGMTWSQISEKHGFDFQVVASEARKVARQAKRADRESRQALERGRVPGQAPETVPGMTTPPGTPPGMQQQPPSTGP